MPPDTPILPMMARIRSLAVTPVGSELTHVDREGLRPALQQALRRQHVADFRGADAEGEGAERAMRRGVAVAADDRLARLREPELGPDDVHDAAAAVLQVEQLDAELLRVDLELPHLLRRGIHRDGHAAEHLLGARGRRVIHGGEREIRPAQLEAARAQLRVGLRRRHFVREVQIDEQDGGRIGGLGNDHVVVPDFFEHGFWHVSSRRPPSEPTCRRSRASPTCPVPCLARGRSRPPGSSP